MKFNKIADILPLMNEKSLAALAEDISKNGLREPIILHNGKIIDGRNRFLACKKVGVEPKFREWDGRGSLLHFVVSLNLARRHLTMSQRACLATEILPLLEQEARRRQATSTGGSAPRPVRAKMHKAGSGRAAEQAARVLQVGGRYVAYAKAIRETEPELFAEVSKGATTLQQARQEVARRRKITLVERINSQPVPLPGGPFRSIVVDPAWPYDSVRTPYPQMALDEIKALPVSKMSEDNCVLWLWTTNAHMRVAFDVLEAWGFEHKTILTWAKPYPGVGSWLRGQTEHCIMAVKGNPVVTLSDESTLLTGARRQHSRKPEEFYKLVESLCPGSKLEMFARQRRHGWQSWGAEVDQFAAAS